MSTKKPIDDAKDSATPYDQMISRARRQAESIGSSGVAAGALSLGAVPFAGPPSDSFTGYQILREVHRGGQGVVYQAVQESTSRKVAIKVLREGPFASEADRARFGREAEILGQLHHPGIVAIHDTGVAAGHQFLVMDYVSGQPLDVYIASGERSVDETLRLFATICDAVNAAHLRGIIHRDLKPNNVRIDAEGAPHVLDFGLAKVATPNDTSAMTLTGQFVGSLPWAAPEQAEGVPKNIDVRTDVYSLGVILYQMLTRQFPYEVVGNMPDVLDRIMHAEPVRPSTLRPEINDEVETIVLKCLQKENDRRYQSAGELARDVRRYLAGEPIEAKRDSTGYVFRKQLRKHRLPIALAAAFLVLLIGFGVALQVMTASERDRAEREAEAAREARDEAERIAQFLEQTIADVTPWANPDSDTTTLLRMLDASAERVMAGELRDAPEVELRVRLVLGRTYSGLGAAAAARQMVDPAVELARSIYGGDHERVAAALHAQGNALTGPLGGGFEIDQAALQKHQAALEIRRRLYKSDHPALAASLNVVAKCLQGLGRYMEAMSLFDEALEMRQRLFPGDDPAVVETLFDVAYCLTLLGRAPEALSKAEAAHAMQQRLYPADHPGLAHSLQRVAMCLQAVGRAEEALPKYEAALEMNRQFCSDDSLPGAIYSRERVAECLVSLGRTEEALREYEILLEQAERGSQGDSMGVKRYLDFVGGCLRLLDRPEEALPLLERALEIHQRTDLRDDPELAWSLNRVALCLDSLGRMEEALEKYEAALDMTQRLFNSEHPHMFCQDVPVQLREEYASRLAEVREFWRDTEAGAGYPAKATEWLTRFAQWKTTTQPAAPTAP